MSKLVLAATLLATSLSAFAEGATYDYPVPAVSGITRAQVIAETRLARAQGAIANGEQSYVAPTVGRALSRAEVQQATELARANGEIPIGEFSFVAEERHALKANAALARVNKAAVLR